MIYFAAFVAHNAITTFVNRIAFTVAIKTASGGEETMTMVFSFLFDRLGFVGESL